VPVGDRFASLEGEGEDAWLLLSVQGAFDSPGGTLGLAVSGGGDSMALLHLAARVAPQAGWSVRAVTVDHRLRPEAADEAALVAQVCAGLGVPHDVVVWQHDGIAGNLMQAARQARYRLMAEWAAARGITTVALAHTADDDAETFLIGLSRAAGLEGLSGMRHGFVQDGVAFRRPLLGQSRSELRGFLRRNGLVWVDDPTNEDDRFTRTRVRKTLQMLAPLGVTVERLAGVIHNLQMAQGVVTAELRRAAQDIVTETAGALVFDRRAFLLLGPEVDRLLLRAMLRWMTGAPHGPRESGVMGVQRAIAEGRDATLAGCRFVQRDGAVTLVREPRAVGGAVPVGAVWDGRWRVTGPAGEVRALGAEGLAQVPGWRDLGVPRVAALVLPGVWDGDRLISAPVLGFGKAYAATLTAPFGLFLLSH
jgi:tRNA(Ile)-lysidine synthase